MHIKSGMLAAGLMSAALGLAACAGGGGGGSSGTTGSTGSTGTTTATNSSLTNLVATQSFANAGASAVALVNVNLPGVGAATVTRPATDSFTINYNASTQSYTITGAGMSQTFTQADKSASSNSIATAYSKTNGNTQDALALFVPGAANTRLNLTYSSFGNWLRGPTTGAANATAAFFVYGIPTVASDMPKTGSASYQTAVSGLWEASNDLRTVTGTGTLSADFAAGTTQVSLNLGGVSQFNGSTSTLGAFNGSGAIDGANATFSGNLASAGGSSAGYSGTYAGRFFGPAAVEAGAAFSLSNTAGAAVTGVIMGKK